MAARKKSRKPGTLTQASMERLVARAFKRNGDNSILLDMAEDVGSIKADINSIFKRLAAIEPAVWKLEGKRQQGIGQSALIARIFTLPNAAWTAATACAAYVAHLVSAAPKP